MLEIKPKLNDRYAMHTWLKKLRNFVRTTLSHKFILDIKKVPRNYDYGMGDGSEQEGMLSIFNNTGRSYGRAKLRYFLDD